MHYNLNTETAQSSGLENIGLERPLSDLVAPKLVLSPTRITLENNGKIRLQPDRENAFARASGGGSVTNTELSPVPVSSSGGCCATAVDGQAMLQSTATIPGVPMVVKVARSMAASTKTDLIPLIPVYSTKTPCKTSTCVGTLDLERSIHD